MARLIHAQTSDARRPLIGKWLVEDIGGAGVIDRAQATIEIGKDGSVSGSTSVNRYNGRATIEDIEHSFRTACDDPSCRPAGTDGSRISIHICNANGDSIQTH